MKKLIVGTPWKHYLLSRSKYELESRKRSEERKLRLRQSVQGANKHKLKPLKRKKYVDHFAPSNFSLINNCTEVIRYFQEAAKLFQERNQINFNLSEIESLTPDAIAFLVAFIKEPKFTHQLDYKGKSPSNPKFSKMFRDSGFYDYVSSPLPRQENHKNALIHKITKNRVENTIAKEVCQKAMAHSFTSKGKFQPLYEVIIECMANTNNHADYKKRGKYNWWIFQYNDPDSKSTSFSFLDLGVGIFKSLPVQTHLRKFFNLLGVTSNVNLVPKLFAGEISSRTGLEERGQGMPLIFDRSQNEKMRAFYLISNNVYADMKAHNYQELALEFPGTFLYWEVRE